MLYPLKFTPVYKQIIWGGDNIRRHFNRVTPFEKVAESWELCCRSDGMSIVSEGPLKGKTFTQVISDFKEKVLGTKSIEKYGCDFPLLIKLIDANGKLSVQVHPDDAYAQSCGEKNGKNELWYIVDAKPGAKLVYGLKDGVTKEDFTAAMRDDAIASTLRQVPVAPGDVFYIPAGTVHAILNGILVAEIQQNSNTTYRIYDWGRVDADNRPRELQIDRALDVINFGRELPQRNSEVRSGDTGCSVKTVLRCEFFNIDEVDLDGKFAGEAAGDTFYVLMNLGGCVKIAFDGGEMTLESGDTALIPACLGNYTVEGRSKLLLTWI